MFMIILKTSFSLNPNFTSARWIPFDSIGWLLKGEVHSISYHSENEGLNNMKMHW